MVLTEEDADENGWIAVILRIVQHHCGVPFDVRAAPTTTDSHLRRLRHSHDIGDSRIGVDSPPRPPVRPPDVEASSFFALQKQQRCYCSQYAFYLQSRQHPRAQAIFQPLHQGYSPAATHWTENRLRRVLWLQLQATVTVPHQQYSTREEIINKFITAPQNAVMVTAGPVHSMQVRKNFPPKATAAGSIFLLFLAKRCSRKKIPMKTAGLLLFFGSFNINV